MEPSTSRSGLVEDELLSQPSIEPVKRSVVSDPLAIRIKQEDLAYHISLHERRLEDSTPQNNFCILAFHMFIYLNFGRHTYHLVDYQKWITSSLTLFSLPIYGMYTPISL
jgi:hypothetical protein